MARGSPSLASGANGTRLASPTGDALWLPLVLDPKQRDDGAEYLSNRGSASQREEDIHQYLRQTLMRNTMNPIPSQEAFQILRRAGFVGAEIDRLSQLRRSYPTSERDQPPLDLNRLQCIQWLVSTGRLTEQIPEEETRDVVPPMTSWSRLKILLARLYGDEASPS